MLKYIFMWALICSAAPVVRAQMSSPDEEAEADEPDIMLNEVTVVAKNIITKTDRQVIIPPKSKVEASTSGLDLLQKLALPGISVNQLTGSINLISGGSPELYIDGVPATESQIKALDPEMIVRIVYHDHPGVRFGNADAVIEYFTRKKDHGGRLSVESMDCIGDGKYATIDELAAQWYKRKSAWAVNAGYMQMKRNNWVRDYDEIWHYPEHDVIRSEKGLPVEIGTLMMNSSINYRYAHDESNTLNARISLNVDDTPNKEEGDRHSWLTTSESQEITEVREHTSERSLRPSISLHFRHIFDKAGALNVNLEGAWLKSKSAHSYMEAASGEKLCDIFSKIRGDRYGLFAEGVHEIALGPGRLVSGIRHTQSHTSNHYLSETSAPSPTIRINQSETWVFAEYEMNIAKWGIICGASGKRLSSSQELNRLRKYALLPRASISYSPADNLFFRYNAQFDRKMPPVAAISDISQEIQPGMIRCGNPDIKTFSGIEQSFSASYNSKYVRLNLSVNYLDESKPAMNCVVYDKGIFVRTVENQKYFRKFNTEAMIAVTPWKDHLTLWVSHDFSRYFSRGKEYDVVKNMSHLHFGADASYRHFILTACTMSGAANHMYGDEMISEKPMNMILAGYRGSGWTLQAGVFNLMKNYWMRTENFSPLTPFKSTAHCGKNVYFTVKVSFNLNFGKRHDHQDDELYDATQLDMDSGIVNGLK